MAQNVSAAKFLLYDGKGGFLLQHRTEDAEWAPGYWGFFGGAIDDGEQAEEAVKREAKEETAYILREPFLFMEYDFVSEKLCAHIFLYIEQYNNVSPIILGEGQGYGWFTVDELRGLKMSERDITIVKFVDQHLKRSDTKRAI